MASFCPIPLCTLIKAVCRCKFVLQDYCLPSGRKKTYHSLGFGANFGSYADSRGVENLLQ